MMAHRAFAPAFNSKFALAIYLFARLRKKGAFRR